MAQVSLSPIRGTMSQPIISSQRTGKGGRGDASMVYSGILSGMVRMGLSPFSRGG